MNEAFYFVNNESCYDLKSLKKNIVKLSQEEFNHHVNNEKNDFSNWVKYSLGNHSLSKDINSAHTKAKILKVLDEKLNPGSSNKVNSTKKSSYKESKSMNKESARDYNTSISSRRKEESDVINYKHLDSPISYISTEAPNTFILKEFLFGALFGLLLGLILMAMLVRSGAYL